MACNALWAQITSNTLFWYICEGGGRRNMEEAADGSKGGGYSDVSLELFSWALCPLGVGSRAG